MMLAKGIGPAEIGQIIPILTWHGAGLSQRNLPPMHLAPEASDALDQTLEENRLCKGVELSREFTQTRPSNILAGFLLFSLANTH